MRPCFIFVFLLSFGIVCAQPSKRSIDSLRLLVQHSDGVQKAFALQQLAQAYAGLNQDSTIRLTEDALAICRQLKNDTAFILVAGTMQFWLGSIGQQDVSHRQLIEARNLKSPVAMGTKYQNSINVALHFLHYYSYTRYDSAVYYGLRSLALAPPGISVADRSILVGAAYNKKGDNIKALEFYHKAEAILDSLPFYEGEHCYLYNQMGMLYTDEGDLKRAEHYFLRSIQLGKAAGGYPQISPVTNLAVVYDRMGDHVKALKYLDSATTLLPTKSDPWRTAINVRNKGHVLTHAGKPREGIVETMKALELYRRLKDDYSTARIHLQLAEPYRLLGDFRTAEREALQALEWDRKHGYGELVKEAYRELARIYAATNQFAKALDYQNRYLAILDSLNSAERRNQFVQIEKNFENALQERQREQLRRENELNMARADAERQVRIYLTVGTVVLLAAVIITVIAYRRMRSQNTVLNQQKKKIEEQADQLQEAAAIKSRFFANVSHELRTPVTLLHGMLELMKNQPARRDEGQKLDIALASSRRLQGMLNEVLDLSRAEAGKLTLAVRPTELLPLLTRIVYAFESLMERRQLRLEFDAAILHGIWIDLDEDKFEKVINNLIHNAIKFNRERGSVRVTAQTTENSVSIEVADTGAGIAEKELPFVFDRFYQAGSTEKLRAEGVGIGLSLVREYTELHGGHVRVDSVLGEGSRFTIELPRSKVSNDSEVVGEEFAEIPDVDFNSFEQAPRILVVEDNDEMRFYLREMLGPAVVMSEARNGKEGLNWLEANTPDLIISDVMMPEMDGPEFLQHLKRTPEWRGIPMVMLTARASDEDLLQGLSLGVDDYIIKPFNARELKIRIHNLITNQNIRRQWQQKPLQEDEVVMTGPGEDDLLREKIRLFVEAQAHNTALGIGDLCEHLAMSERQLYRRTATLTGMTPAQLIKEIRMKIAYRLLLERNVSKVADVAKRVGFENPSYFSRQFELRFGQRPTEML